LLKYQKNINKEQTNWVIINKTYMENIIHKIFDIRMFENILFVDDNPAVVKSISIEKVGDEIKRTETKMIYNLDRKINLDDDETETINRIISKFFINLNFISVDIEIKYFDRNILFKLLKRKNYDDILKQIKGYDWVITNDIIIKEFEKSPDFEILDSKTEIKLVGRINNTLIYQNPIDTESKIFLGKKESMTAVFKKDSEFIEYLYQINGNINKLTIS
jgi:hypothetical protein